METNEIIEVEEVKKLTMAERLKYFFTNPNKLFENYEVKATWLGKFLIIMVLALAYSFMLKNQILGPQMDMILSQTPNLSQEEAAFAAQIASTTLVVMSVIVIAITVFLVPLIYWGLLSLFGGKTRYMKVVAVYTLAYIPVMIGSFVTLGIAYYTNNYDSLLQPQMLDALLNRLNLFVIWQVLLLIFGFAKIANIKIIKSAFVVGILWLIYTGYAVGSIMLMRMY